MILALYNNIIIPADYSNNSMTLKEQFMEIVDELLKSMCKALVTGEEPAVAESEIAVLRSDKDDFQQNDTNYLGVSSSAHVLLGPTLKEQYSDWQCSDSQTCNGACVGTGQVCFV